jgi:hypothetical protein
MNGQIIKDGEVIQVVVECFVNCPLIGWWGILEPEQYNHPKKGPQFVMKSFCNDPS